MTAIRAACSAMKVFRLEGCELYTSCEPCPMCLSAAYWAGISRIYYGNNRKDAAEIGFGDAFIYDEVVLAPSRRSIRARVCCAAKRSRAFRLWREKSPIRSNIECFRGVYGSV